MRHVHRVSIRRTFTSGTTMKLKALKEASVYSLVGIELAVRSTSSSLPPLIRGLTLNKHLPVGPRAGLGACKPFRGRGRKRPEMPLGPFRPGRKTQAHPRRGSLSEGSHQDRLLPLISPPCSRGEGKPPPPLPGPRAARAQAPSSPRRETAQEFGGRGSPPPATALVPATCCPATFWDGIKPVFKIMAKHDF